MVRPVGDADGLGRLDERAAPVTGTGSRRHGGQLAGDRMLTAVALVILAAVVTMGAFALVAAERIDANSQQRWGRLVAGMFERRREAMERDLASVARWDVARVGDDHALDTERLHAGFGRWLYESLHHDRSYIIHGEHIDYASVDGQMQRVETAQFDRMAIRPLVAQVQADVVAQAQLSPSERAGEGVHAEAFRATYTRIEGRPALVGAIGIPPKPGEAPKPASEQAVAVSAVFLDRRFMAGLTSEFQIAEPQLSEGPPPAARPAVAVPFSDPGARPAWITWAPEKPGRDLLRALLPALMGTAALLLLAAAIVLWYARRATRELAESEALASRLAYIDPLSGLANRAMLMRLMSERLPEVTPEHRLAVLFIDLDGFKDVNDTLGHFVGDLLLAEIGRRLEANTGPDAIAARFGGDEFVVVMPVGTDDAAIGARAMAILEAVRRPAQIGDQSLSVNASIGATVAPDHGSAASELIRLADIAVYRAKAEGRATFRLFEPSLEAELQQRRAIENDLAAAIAGDALEVYYQPQMETDGVTVAGVEAVVRWPRADGSTVSPAAFVPVAEQTGLITALDMWVLRQACRQTRDWGLPKLAVNLSPVDFRSRDLVPSIAAILRETGFDPHRLEVEITENLLFGNQPEAFAALSALRAMGVRVALDDFGSGYSSLGYVRRFRVDTIKIDRSFTQNVGLTDDAAAIIDCVVRLGRALGITVTAEGVETREQLRYLQQVGCHHVQGFLFAPPMPVARVEQFLMRASRRFGVGGNGGREAAPRNGTYRA
ncbi:putative bifunctional diguanylate cyclase/phosphodiesterase [Ancylobacter terrae]|uniref:putative bifunctional diguanylate cyclase/phosphodiesterase n=1 Tax=Ancylobacter sp. sgz301288 TaxID=3342077 RepID=UPI00385D8910